MRIQRYTTTQPWNAGKTDIMFHLDVAFRSTHIITSVTEHGKAFLNGFFIAGSEESQLLGEIDCYEFSMELKQRQCADFLREHGLVGKLYDEIDFRLSLPIVQKGETIRLTGRTSEDFMVSLMGDAIG